MVPVECVARGYLTGSGLLDYQRTGAVCGIALPPGLAEASKFDEPDVHPGDQGRVRRARREHLVRPGDRAGRRRPRDQCASAPCRPMPRRRTMP
jgi:phosphoribosylaminoimidazole-succinocarboxamide synthase